MLELALHVLDIGENSIRAGASLLRISITEDLDQDRLTIAIDDNGQGMGPQELAKVCDPFFTTKQVRRIGMGVPLLKQAAEAAAGSFRIDSVPGKGTEIQAVFEASHLDRQPLGDMAGAVATLIVEAGKCDIIYQHRRGDSEYKLDTAEIRHELEDVPLNHPEVIAFIRRHIEEGLVALDLQ